MATTKKSPATPVTKASMLTQDQPDRFRLSEMGALGLQVFNGVSNDDLKRELNWPMSIRTFKQMNAHGTINSAMTLFDNIIGKAHNLVLCDVSTPLYFKISCFFKHLIDFFF